MDVKGQHEEAMDQLGERATLAAKLQSELTKADQQNHSFSKEVRTIEEDSREWFFFEIGGSIFLSGWDGGYDFEDDDGEDDEAINSAVAGADASAADDGNDTNYD